MKFGSDLIVEGSCIETKERSKGWSLLLYISTNSASGRPTIGVGSAMISVIIKSPACGILLFPKVMLVDTISFPVQSVTPAMVS